MDQANENSKLLCNSCFGEIVFNQTSNRDFKRPEQFRIDNAKLLPNASEYKQLIFSSLLPSSSSLQGPPHVQQHNPPYSKNFKVLGTSKKELEQVMKKHLQFKGIITNQELSGKLDEGVYLVSKKINSPVWQHCSGLIVLPNGREYFDPTGKEPTDFNSEFNYTYNTVKVQDDNNMTCGPHSCFWLSKRLEKYSMSEIIQLYPSQNGGTMEENDNMVNDYFNNAYINSMKIVQE